MARTYSYGELETLWTQAGGPKALAPLMAAIALAESGGNPQATNPNDNGGTQTSWGLWQISDGTHNQPAANILSPQVNAKAAVAKYQAQGLGAWGTYTTGAYKQYYQGNIPAQNLPQGGTNANDQQANLTAFGVDFPDWALGPQGIIQSVAQSVGNMLGSAVTGQAGTAGGLEGIWKAATGIAADFNAMMAALNWLFVPGNWVRIFCFGGGLLTGIAGLRMLSRAGDGTGSLASGIMLVTLSGMFFFLAFHNLPEDVTDLQSLLGFISQGIRSHAPGTPQPGQVLA